MPSYTHIHTYTYIYIYDAYRWWHWASQVAQCVKNPHAMQETGIQSLGWEISWRRKWQPTPVFLPGKSHGRRSLVDYSPWGQKESDTTERLHLTLRTSLDRAYLELTLRIKDFEALKVSVASFCPYTFLFEFRDVCNSLKHQENIIIKDIDFIVFKIFNILMMLCGFSVYRPYTFFLNIFLSIF